jgi:hypothetical protein
MLMWLYVTNHLIISNDKDSNSETNEKLHVCDNDHSTYIIMDVLDECPNSFGMPSPGEVVLDFVKELVELPLPNLHICIASQLEIDIQTFLGPLTTCQVSLYDELGKQKTSLSMSALSSTWTCRWANGWRRFRSW